MCKNQKSIQIRINENTQMDPRCKYDNLILKAHLLLQTTNLHSQPSIMVSWKIEYLEVVEPLAPNG